MEDVQELRERTNPVFNTARATLLQLAQAGHADAALMAEKLGLDLAGMTYSDEQKKAMGQSNVATLELRYKSMNAFIQATGAKTIVDMYTRLTSGSWVIHTPPNSSRMRRMLSSNAASSESVKYIKSPSVVMHSGP